MQRIKHSYTHRVIHFIVFILMVGVNYLANALPINGITTGELSDLYPNLFVPAGITFAIWGLIYLLLFGFVLYPFGVFGNVKSFETIQAISPWFIVSSLANMAWVFLWHYQWVGISVVVMLVLLISLIVIRQKLQNMSLSKKEQFFLRLPFSIYFGWITIATIANITTFLVSIGWDGFGIREEIWTVIVLLVGLVIGALTTWKLQDIAYGGVILWAYVGILVKHLSPQGFSGKYTLIIGVVVASLILMGIVVGYVTGTRKNSGYSR
jgi:hypothetical protein